MPNSSPPNRLFVLWAWIVSGIRVNRTALVSNEDGQWLCKTRAWWGVFPVMIGNFFFRFRRPRLRVLPTRQWMQWEQTLNPSTRIEKSAGGDKLLLKLLPGQPLESVFAAALEDSTFDTETALDLLGVATHELKVFHQRTVHFENGEVLLSHGDASLANVLIDVTLGTAIWFDFDLQHDLSEPALTRQADDLRALLFTSAPWLSIDDIPLVVAFMREAWFTDATEHQRQVWAELERLIGDGSLRWDLFHQAQCRRTQAGKDGAAVSWAEIHRCIETAFKTE